MTRLFSILVILIPAAAAPLPPSQTPVERAWLNLQQGVTSKKAGTRAIAAHALRLVTHDARAEEMAERALTDSNPKVRAAAARALGPMGAASSVPRLKALLNDRDPAVVLAAAHSLYLLGDRADVYDLDCELLSSERKGADGAVASQLKELRDPHALAVIGFETGIGFVPFGGDAYEAYKRLAKDDRTPVRVAAAKELATDSDPKVDAALARACSDKKWAVRAAAIYAIAKRDDPTLITAITPLLGDKKEIVRYEAAAAVLRLSRDPSTNQESETTARSIR
jgi:HEAT repeat protein